jgi:PAS domain S-box-containing protein
MLQYAHLLQNGGDWIAQRAQELSRTREYLGLPFHQPMAWRDAVEGLTRMLTDPDDETPLAQLLGWAGGHRANGVALHAFLGVLDCFRQAFHELVSGGGLPAQKRESAQAKLASAFDRLLVLVAKGWAAPDPGREAEMAAARTARNEAQRLSTVFQALPSAVLLADIHDRVMDLNLSACRWLSQSKQACPSRLEFLGRPMAELLPWVGPALTRLHEEKAGEQGGMGSMDTGEKLAFLDTRVFPLHDAAGTFDGSVVVLHDITALREAGESQARIASELRGQLREAVGLNRLSAILGEDFQDTHALLRRLAEALPECWDLACRLNAFIDFDATRYASDPDAASDPGGLGIEEPLNILGRERGILRLESPQESHAFVPTDRAMLAAMARQIEHVIETRQSLEMLRQSERQFRTFFDSAADAIFIHDETGRILDANKAAGIWLNAATERLTGTNLLDNFAGADREMATARFLNALRGDPELFQATLTRRDGFAIPAELLCQGQSLQGRPALVTTGRNIAARLRAQAEIERRLEMEALVSTISGRLINSAESDMPRAIGDCIADLSRFFGMPRGAVFLLDDKQKAFRLSFLRAGTQPLPRQFGRLGRGKAPWFFERISAGERVLIRDAAHMPPAGRKEKALLAAAGIASLIATPMRVKQRVLGAFVLGSPEVRDIARLADSQVLDQATLLFANAIERLRAATALRRSEGLSRAILDALPANLCVLDHRGALTMVNRSWAATGPESTPLGGSGLRLGLGDNYLNACLEAPDIPAARSAREGILAVLSGKSPSYRGEYASVVHGESRWFVMQATPMPRGLSGAVISHRDITERMRAVGELRESEERFRIIVETAQEAVMNLDSQSRVTYANPRAVAMFGYPWEDLAGRSVLDIVDPADHALLLANVERRKKGHSDRYELRFRHRSGQRIWTMLNASPLRSADGGYLGSVGMITDITDRVRAEMRLRRNEARYRTLVESMHEGLVMARRSGLITYANERFCAMLGRKRSEVAGRPVAAFVTEGSKARLSNMLAAASQGARTDHVGGSEEILWEHAGGRHIYSLVSPSAYTDEDGRVAGFFAVITDTTERKGLESQLLQSQKLEAIGQLAAGIAHEINTPAQYVGNNTQFIKGAFEDVLSVLAATREYLDAAKRGAASPADAEKLSALMAERDIDYLTEEVPGAIAQTLEGVDRISTIVRSVKQFAHPGQAVMAPADLNESMRSTATVSRNEWKYVAELSLELDPGLPLVVCMIGEINQVVLNLIINAAHAIADAKKADPGREGRITLTTRLAPPWAEIRVADTGTGIPAAVQAKIFDPFFTTKEVGRGTGQGLTISRSIVMEKHKGQLFFETSEGVGTTFVVRLPLDQPESPEAA